MKGISTLISALLLIIIVAAIASLLYLFLTTVFTETTTVASNQTSGIGEVLRKVVILEKANCISAGGNNNQILFILRNIGTKKIGIGEIAVLLDDLIITTNPNADSIELDVGSFKQLDYTAPVSGKQNLKISTPSGLISTEVICPELLFVPPFGTWQIMASPVLGSLYSANMNTSTFGFIVGGNTVLNYSDNGWNLNATLTDADLTDVHLANSTFGFAVGSGSCTGICPATKPRIQRFSSGTWTGIQIPTNHSLLGIHMVNSTLGYAAGRNATSGNVLILNYSNGEWKNMTELPINSLIYDIYMINETLGFAVGTNLMLNYTNGLWQEMTPPVPIFFFGLDMLNSTYGFAVGDSGTILNYNNGIWTQMSSPVTSRLWDVDIVNENLAFAVGCDGIIIGYYNGVWYNLPSPTTVDCLLGLSMFNSTFGFAVGDVQTILNYTA